jgi:hypothetical protein
MSHRRLPILCAVLLAACARTPPVELPPLPAASGAVAFREQVQPILEHRCVVCHGCYDAPCQLLLSSPDGIARGASKLVVYDAGRLTAMSPTRLGIDAQTTAEWRERGFFSVRGDAGAAGDASLLFDMLALGHAHPFAPGVPLPAAVGLDINRPLTCARADELPAYAAAHPLGGMPYGMAPLADDELAVLAAWLQQGAALPTDAPPLPPAAARQVTRWEAFLNGESLKQRITARYLYEHWFVAHLYFEDLPAGPFFRVVRSSTPPGEPVRELATVRPYDAPGVDRFWYRLRPIDATIVHKTHIVYPLGEPRLRRLQALFLDADWEPTRLPSYDTATASNPFVSFADIPARARYQFMLDDAQYFVMTFIRGPVCRGQVAVDVIEDHFFVAFLDPDHDPSVIDPTFLTRAAPDLQLPAEHLSRLVPGEFWLQYGLEQRRYLALREQSYDASDPRRLGPTLDFIWDGDGRNPNALLTVFRHFDNATVERGFVGAVPKTMWVVDYPIFERIYYDLVAGYDVFGAVTHQVATRLYMDHLRMQGENLFLTFLPVDQRAPLRASWYVGATSSLDYRQFDRLTALSHGTRIPYRPGPAMPQLIAQLLARNPAVSGPPDLLNRCPRPPCDRPGATPLERRAERALQPLAGVRGPWVASLPEISFLRVHDAGGSGPDALYSLVHNRAHTNVAFMFDEAARLQPADDTLTVGRGVLGSYPNFVFAVDGSQIDAFAQALAAGRDATDFTALVETWGVRRTSPALWPTVDWLHADFRRRQPTQYGLLDLDRYGNY